MKKLLMLGLIALLAVGASWATGDELTKPLNTKQLGSDDGRADAREASDDDTARSDAASEGAGRSIADRRGRMVRMGQSTIVPEELGWKSKWKKKKKDKDDDENGDTDEDEDPDGTVPGP